MAVSASGRQGVSQAGAMAGHSTPRRTIDDRVRASRRREFVGRTEPRSHFVAALRGDRDAARVLLVHGIGGIGKSALLRRLADDAHDAGRAVMWIAGEQVGAAATAFEHVAAACSTAPVALFVDGLEHCRSLETWLREQFLLTLPDHTVVVLAGRDRPQSQWRLDPGWRGLVRELRLGPLDRDETAALMSTWDVAQDRRQAVGRVGRGHPLALCLAAEAATVTTAASFDASAWAADPIVVQTLLGRLIDRAPTSAHEYGLRVSGHVREVTVDLLRTGLDDDTARVVFDWLASLPCVTPSRRGLLMHDLVRDVVAADFAWRSPSEYGRVRVRMGQHLGERLRHASCEMFDVEVGELQFLAGRGVNPMGEFSDDGPGAPPLVRDYTPDLRAWVLGLTRQHQGEEQARRVAYWLDRQPQAFYVYGRADDGRPTSVFAWLRLRPGFDDIAADPVLLPVGEYLRRRTELAETEYVGVGRFIVPGPTDGSATFGSDLWGIQMSVENPRDCAGLVASFVVSPEPDRCADALAAFDFALLAATVDADGRDHGVFFHDWRDVPLSAHLERIVAALDFGSEPSSALRAPGRSRLSRDEHDAAVRQALRDWHDDDAVAANALRTCCAHDSTVRDLLGSAVDALRTDAARLRHQRVVRTTYLLRATSQEATAAHLGIPFSTFRRYLKAGVGAVCEYLWQRHLDRCQ